MINWIGWGLLRIVTTYVCAYTMTNVIQSEGYRVEFTTMLLGAAMLIILIMLWSPRCNHGS